MGIHSNYSCPICNYEFEGSGHRDYGMFTHVHNTYNCSDCKQTFDYYVENSEYIVFPKPRTFWMKVFCRKAKKARIEISPNIQEHEIHCKFCSSFKVAPWEYKCAKCGYEMENLGMVMLWD
jgi:hypothetical protein